MMKLIQRKQGLFFLLLCLLSLFIVACKVETPSDEEIDERAAEVVNDGESAESESEDAEDEAVASDELPVMEEVPQGIEIEESVPKVETAPAILKEGEALTKDGLAIGFTEDGYAYMGNIDAEVVINEYSEYQCPFCARFTNDAFASLRENELKTGDAVLIFHDFPLVSIHPQAMAASNATYCAGEQSPLYYWTMHDILFQNIGSWGVSDPSGIFKTYAEQIPVDDLDAFSTCVDEFRYEDFLNNSLAEAGQLGIRATPSFIINGTNVSGAQPYPVFAQTIEQILAGETPAIAANQPQPTPTLDITDIEVPEPEPVAVSDNYAATMGDPDAPVVIVEFTDYQCPYCNRHSTGTLPTLIEDYIDEGRVYYILWDLPLESIHPLAKSAAIAARCAGEQSSDAYWEMHDVLFANQATWGQGSDADATFIQYATDLELDVETFETCLTSGDFVEEVEKSTEEAMALGIGGTPFFMINGFPIFNGAYPINAFEEVIGMAERGELVDEIKNGQRQAIAQQQLQAEEQEQARQQFTEQEQLPVDLDDSAFSMGAEDAVVTIIEYTDYQCPYCQKYALETFDAIYDTYVETGLVRYVFKDFPLESIHPEARLASNATRCAGEQDAFLEMHTEVFAGQRQWSGAANAAGAFSTYAARLELDVEAFDECLDEKRYDSEISDEMSAAMGIGVRSTPSFLINGKLIAGAQPFQTFQQLIDQELALAETGESEESVEEDAVITE